jgi:uracil-DNA glycosylase family 4
MTWTGKGRKGVLIVAEAPDETEDERGVQLVGKSGQLLRGVLEQFGADLDKDCWKTNAVICHPPENEATDLHVEACRPNLDRAIAELRPEVIVLLGEKSVKSLIGPMWRKSDLGGIGRWAGWRIPSQRLHAWICPTWHPAYLLRQGDPVLELWFRRHLEGAFELLDYPWIDSAGLLDQVEVIHSPGKAAAELRGMLDQGGVFSFDFETNMLKPDHPDARIFSCSVCWEGRRTIAYPMQGEAEEATREFLRSDVPKRGWNIKFEDRWARRIFGRWVRGWEWDGMQAAHILDNRPGITGLKFQAFVRLGIEPYDGFVGGFLKADGSNVPNRIGQAELDDVLRYNGVDSLVTMMLSKIQRTEMGIEA